MNTVRVQEKGQVTTPEAIRRRMKLKKGDLVTFITTEDGVTIKSLDRAAEGLFASLEKRLNARNVKLQDVLTHAQQTGAEDLAREFNLLPEESSILFQALQFQAQSALEAIHTATNSASELTDDEINDEIRQARKLA